MGRNPDKLTTFAAAPGVEGGTSKSDDKDHVALLGCTARVREVREEAQNLITIFKLLDDAVKIEDERARQTEIHKRFTRVSETFELNAASIRRLLPQIGQIFETSPVTRDLLSDTVVRIENSWEQAGYEWRGIADEYEPTRTKLSGGGQPAAGEGDGPLKASVRMRPYLDDVVYWSSFITIPYRINEHLATLYQGQPLDFHAMFADELPDKDRRTTLLAFLKAHPASVSGVIDVERGVILKGSPPDKRVRSLLLPVAAAAAGALTLYLYVLATRSVEIRNDALTEYLVRTYVLIVAGAILHVVLDALKQWRGGDRGFAAMDDWVAWLDVKRGPNMVSVFTVLAVFVGSLAISTAAIEPFAALAIGYGSDSVFDVVIKRFDSAISKTVESTMKVMGQTPSTG